MYSIEMDTVNVKLHAYLYTRIDRFRENNSLPADVGWGSFVTHSTAGGEMIA